MGPSTASRLPRHPVHAQGPAEAADERMDPAQTLVTFKDVVVTFTREEWELLDLPQRTLYWKVMRETCRLLVSLDDKAKTNTTEPSASPPALFEGCSPHRLLTEEDSSVSTLGEAREQERPSEKQGEHIRTGTVPYKETHPEKVNPECDDLVTSKNLGRNYLQEQVSPGDGLLECESHRPRKDTLIHGGKKSYKCKECGKEFIKNHFLLQHQWIHTRVKPYKCKRCGKAFLKKADLTEHQRVHTGEKPYVCIECRKAFSRRSHLTEHQRIHSGEKPYACSECGKAFARHSDFIRHNRTHTGEKPFECKECGKAFCNSFSVTRHMRCHSGEKLYECSECGKTYSYSSTLTTHKKIHSGGKSYKCKRCGKAFDQKAGLSQHQRTHTEFFSNRPF
ncbi:zinc finger protein 80-like [Lutra lutra]|uniref:zinc finger protein 80-like n=1 Tax=Lutra lutra TaxID=9657 RepID=UPI001FD1DE16|nr:zinc finger protein 80-like [Lutra lutra]